MRTVDAERWDGLRDLLAHQRWTCGHCGDKVASRRGYRHVDSLAIFICPSCGWPSVVGTTFVFPSAKPGRSIKHLPDEIATAYEEARRCMSTSSHTATILLCRVLLLRVAKSKEIPEASPSYKKCVQYLVEEGWIGGKDSDWVDRIRVFGNEANHELKVMTDVEATQALEFVQHLLISIFEFRGDMPEPAP